MTNPDEITIPQAVAECEKVADEISDGIKAAMPCDCRAMCLPRRRCDPNCAGHDKS